jgi:hypothetical protein
MRFDTIEVGDDGPRPEDFWSALPVLRERVRVRVMCDHQATRHSKITLTPTLSHEYMGEGECRDLAIMKRDGL